jgi:hypothetical protein
VATAVAKQCACAWQGVQQQQQQQQQQHHIATRQLHARRKSHSTSSRSQPCQAHYYATHGLPLSAVQRAKDLHPDLKAGFSAADGEAFLSLVAAYEVLSDPQQRQLYDIASNSKLPGTLKRAAAAAAADGSGRSDAEEACGSDAGAPSCDVAA